jgi:hypothetical protein
MPRRTRRLTMGELQLIDAQISLAQEQGFKLGDKVTSQSEVCCCCAVAAEAKGKFRYSARDREILGQIARLESQISSAPTLRALIQRRGELLREVQRKG